MKSVPHFQDSSAQRLHSKWTSLF